jgi:hypothetical protein
MPGSWRCRPRCCIQSAQWNGRCCSATSSNRQELRVGPGSPIFDDALAAFRATNAARSSQIPMPTDASPSKTYSRANTPSCGARGF